MNFYLKKTLSNEQGSIIREPMLKECLVSVMIPVFDESVDILLTPLLSLATQIGADKQSYEVVMIVNNNKETALNNTESFLKNQRALELIKFLKWETNNYPFLLTDRQKAQAEEIRKSGLVIHAIDKCSLNNADDYYNVGVAKNRAGAEICQRFMSVSAGEKGIIALTDCDSWFSDNYIAYIIGTYEHFNLNGLSGSFETVADPALENGDLVLRCLRLQHGFPPNRTQKPPRMLLQKKQKISFPLLRDSQNITVTVNAWLAVNGGPKFASWENRYFINNILALPGEVGRNTGYRVFTWARASQRAGFTAFGRRVAEAEKAVRDFKQGKTRGILLLDENKAIGLIRAFYAKSQNKSFSVFDAKKLAAQYGFLGNYLPDDIFRRLIESFRREMALPVMERRFDECEKIILEHLYPYFPKMDVSKGIY